MLQFFGGGGGAQKFDATPVAGRPSIAIGNGTFGGGGTPDFQGIAALGVNMSASYSDNLFDFQIAGVSKLSANASGSLIAHDITATHAMSANRLASNGNNLLLIPDAGSHSIIVSEFVFHTQTADLLSIQDGNGIGQLSIANTGTAIAPVWALRVAPTVNAESMAQAHVGGASTGKAIQVVDNAGTTLGWLQLLA